MIFQFFCEGESKKIDVQEVILTYSSYNNRQNIQKSSKNNQEIMGMTLLIQSTAFIVGSSESSTCGLMDLSRDLGFFAILNFKNMALVEQQITRTPICFFLFSLECEKSNIPVIAALIRSNRNRQIRFAPMIGFTEAANSKTINICLQLGFDDILLPPFGKKNIAPRLEQHIKKPHIYFEANNYFGPDRRVGAMKGSNAFRQTRRRKTKICKKFTIARDMESGVRVVKEQIVDGGPPSKGHGQTIML